MIGDVRPETVTLSSSLQVTHTSREEWEQFIIQLVSTSTRDQDLRLSRVLFLSCDKYEECSSLLDWELKGFEARDTLGFIFLLLTSAGDGVMSVGRSLCS